MTTDPRDRCAAHGLEPVPPGCYLVCGECGHAFATAADLLAGHNRWCAELGVPPATDADDVAVCPECTHDL